MSEKVIKRAAKAIEKFAKTLNGTVQKKPRNPGIPGILTPQLSQLVNQTMMTKPQALKALWVYIKSNNTPKVGTSHYHCSGPLLDVIGKQTFNVTDVMRAVSKHVLKNPTPPPAPTPTTATAASAVSGQ